MNASIQSSTNVPRRKGYKPFGLVLVQSLADFEHMTTREVSCLVVANWNKLFSDCRNAPLVTQSITELFAPASVIYVAIRDTGEGWQFAKQAFEMLGPNWPMKVIKTSPTVPWEALHEGFPYTLFQGHERLIKC